MKKGLTELVFILDRSGSMGGLESDTIGGFNGMLLKQKKEEGEANVTTVLFDDQIEIVHDRFPLTAVKELTDEDYYVRGSTALLDAVGTSVEKMENIQKRLPEEMRAEHIIFVITTDGMENSSMQYTSSMVKKMISRNQENGWKFIFLGANMDAVQEAENLGIKRSRAVNFECDRKGVGLNFSAAGGFLSKLRSAGDDWDDDDEDEAFEDCMAPVINYKEGKKR